MSDYHNKELLVLGCGNILFGDDGFGPQVIEYLLKNYEVPHGVSIINAGLSVRDILFTITLNENRPKKIIIVDAVDLGRSPGETFELDVSELPNIKIDDFSMHQLPTSNLLKELNSICGVDIKIISAQVKEIPDHVSPGLSPAIQSSIPEACAMILNEIM